MANRLNPSVTVGIGLGFWLSLAISVTMTLHDWHLNPNSVFIDSGMTQWGRVFDTAWSWFLPLMPSLTLLCIGVHWLLETRKKDRLS
ncbi:hypothetical protein [Paraferrimonas sedimenticola]|uniref:Uncharacterized protein n=1 Tax=Paraferrimonas sedimenticola TaxID=375674 RepID=A0AA37RSF1_9GAMM|nr:hypothetical protein [Paraferrimonas sedimenticola]GLP95100.1 hypothetical protein GCM10007895_04060 [Paraferrimonas sedimenticola]